MKVGYIGIGLMGYPCCCNLLFKGFSVAIWARDPKKAQQLLSKGATWYPTPAALAENVDVLITNVSNTADVEKLLFGKDGIVYSSKKGLIILDMSTISATATMAMGEKLKPYLMELVDAPVSGGTVGAQNGTLTFMVGASEPTFKKITPVLQAMGTTITRIGELGAGQVAKSCNQIFITGAIAAAAEAFTFAKVNKVNPALVRQALLGGLANSKIMELHGQRMVDNAYPPGFKTELHLKDMHIVDDIATELHLDMPITKVGLSLLEQAVSAGYGQEDSAAIAKLYNHPAEVVKRPLTINLAELIKAYFNLKPDVQVPEQAVHFGTSGHRGSAFNKSFNEPHIEAITQAVCEWRKKNNITGPLYIGKDTHALSGPALTTALRVLIANKVQVYAQCKGLPTPTPVISHAILCHNKTNEHKADGIVVTPSHNPPQDGGFKYNEYHGGPASAETTAWIEARANQLLQNTNLDVPLASLDEVTNSPLYQEIDFIEPYVSDLDSIINFSAIANSDVTIAADPLGGASLPYWQPIADKYKFSLTIVNDTIDPSFSFMTPDHDGVIRMDCSSASVMTPLVSHASQFDLAFANDPDADRHGIVTPEGLMNPNHYLSVVVWYLLHYREKWQGNYAVGKTVVTTNLINRICAAKNVPVYETPVGFKWFVDGLFTQQLVFGGEESAGASFLRIDKTPWSTDKDGIIMNLLAAEMTAVTKKNPAQLYASLIKEYGTPYYKRIDAPATAAQKKALSSLTSSAIQATTLAGDTIESIQTTALGNNAPIGGIKVTSHNGWFAARPSGTEELYKIYAESFVSANHLEVIIQEAQDLINAIFSHIPQQ